MKIIKEKLTFCVISHVNTDISYFRAVELWWLLFYAFVFKCSKISMFIYRFYLFFLFNDKSNKNSNRKPTMETVKKEFSFFLSLFCCHLIHYSHIHIKSTYFMPTLGQEMCQELSLKQDQESILIDNFLWIWKQKVLKKTHTHTTVLKNFTLIHHFLLYILIQQRAA